MDTGVEYGSFQQPPSYPTSYPPAIVPAGYFSPTVPSYNAHARGPHFSAPSQYPTHISYPQSSFTSNPFSPQSGDQDVPIESLNLPQSAVDKVKYLSKMADPLSLIASVVAIATAAVHVSQTLYKLADTLGGTNSEVGSIALEIETFSSVLEGLRDVLEDAEDLITPKALKNANTILSICKEIFQTIQRMLIPYKDLPQLNFWHIV
jgi:Fungal N-terminal domain of STAND proteins